MCLASGAGVLLLCGRMLSANRWSLLISLTLVCFDYTPLGTLLLPLPN